jgi:peptide/nickel transport system substrate-binding protein
VQLVLEANEKYWRRAPAIKRIVMKVIPDEATRLVALKRGEIDIAYSIRGELAMEAQKTPGLSLKIAQDGATYYLYFPEQWDAESPWSDVRVRRAAFHAIDYKSINDALCLGHCRLSSNFVPHHLQFYWPAPAPEFNQAKARQLLAQAGHPNGFDAGFYWCDSSYANLGEAAVNSLAEVGIIAKLRPLERAAFDKGFTDKRYKKGIIQGSSAAFGNASTRLSVWAIKGGAYAYGSYPELDQLYEQQLAETDIAKRAALLEHMQRIILDKQMYVNLWQLAFINAAGPRVGEAGIGLVKTYVYTGPYEDLTLKDG